MGQKIRLLIVDDSATQRRLVQRHAEAGGRFAIVGSAASAGEALVLLRRCDPEVMTLDVDMPGMDGIAFLRRLMTSRPMPVVMLSASTAAGSTAALEALCIGAVDCLEKGAAILCPGADSLAERLAAAAGAQIPVTGARRHPMPPPPVPPAEGAAGLCLIGASTGGVPALEEILMAWPRDCPPTAIVQHMPARYIVRFAERLDRRAQPAVGVAADGDRLLPGRVLFAPGDGMNLTVLRDGNGYRARLVPHDPCLGQHCPSVEGLFGSALPFAGRVLAVLLTGMGRDGVAAMGRLRHAGARTFAQDRGSSTIFGMPGAALASGAAAREVPLAAMAGEILAASGRTAPGTMAIHSPRPRG